MNVSVERPGVSPEEIVEALEQATREARARLLPPQPLEEPVAEPPGAPPPFGPPPATRTIASLAAGLLPEHIDDPDADRPVWTYLPPTLLWTPPRANLLQPRMFAMPITLDNASTFNTIDTAVGGTVGLLRRSCAGEPDEGFQADVFGVVLSRWSDNSNSVANDYRFGFPLTWRCGSWEGKLAYEHTSTHLGDDFVEESRRFKVGHIRDEVVLGVAYHLWDCVRLYGIFGYSVYITTPGAENDRKDRYDLGVEWERPGPTGWRGQPFAAVDLELRADENYTANWTAQAGWQWKPELDRPSLRVALTYYDGRSPFGQFFLDREDWFGVGLLLDY